jgi:hypothetical protein
MYLSERFIMFDMVCGTWGARPSKDGNGAIRASATPQP